MAKILSIVLFIQAKGESTIKKQFEDPFRILMNLWAHKNVIKDLEAIRLNPNHLNLKGIRNDLEFYIPQLWYLYGEIKAPFSFLANMKSLRNFLRFCVKLVSPRSFSLIE